jgi:hypothetical protein
MPGITDTANPRLKPNPSAKEPEPAGLRRFEKQLKERMEPVGALEILTDTREWLNWTRHFGSISGNDAKLENPAERYVGSTFCYGVLMYNFCSDAGRQHGDPGRRG